MIRGNEKAQLREEYGHDMIPAESNQQQKHR
jgi:hypothetical protein